MAPAADTIVHHRPRPLLSFLARSSVLLRRQHVRRGRLGQEEVCAGTRGLLRVLTSQEGGQMPMPRQLHA
jgi:hypothetical protein